MKKQLVFFVMYSLVIASSSVAQDAAKPTPTVIDYKPSATGRLNLAYDSSFALRIFTKNTSTIYTVSLIKHNGSKPLNSYLTTKNTKQFRIGPDDKTDSTVTVKFDYVYNNELKKIKTSYLKDKIAHDDPADTAADKASLANWENQYYAGQLKPAFKYSIVILHDFVPQIYDPEDNKALFQNFYNYCHCIEINANDSSKCKSEDKIAQKQFKKIYTDAAQSEIQTLSGTYQENLAFFFSHGGYKSYKELQKDVDSIKIELTSNAEKSLFATRSEPIHSSLPTVFNFLECQKLPFKKIYPKNACQDSSCGIAKTLKSIWLLTPANIIALHMGYLTIQDILSGIPPAQTAKLQSRINTLQKSKGQLQDAYSFLVDLQIALNHSTYNAYKADIDDMVNVVAGEISSLSNAVKLIKSLQNSMTSCTSQLKNNLATQFSGIDIYNNADTYIYDFQTRTATYITPVFGYAVFGLQKDFTGFVPYLGFQINFEPMNMKVPFRHIQNKRFLQRLIFTTAWTLGSVSKQGKRQDFFGNSSSLITSLGFKLSHAFFINVGTIWFRRIDPNPLITDKKIVASPALSLSINLDIKNLLNGFTGLIPSL